jgi:hypothetical protein
MSTKPHIIFIQIKGFLQNPVLVSERFDYKVLFIQRLNAFVIFVEPCPGPQSPDA